jgi:hypothetical protein
MDPIPFSAVVMVIILLLVVWLFLAHMVSSRKVDARLEFLLSLMDAPQADPGRSDPVAQRPAAIVPETNEAKPSPGRADEFASLGRSSVARSVLQELPVVFAAALRGRAM